MFSWLEMINYFSIAFDRIFIRLERDVPLPHDEPSEHTMEVSWRVAEKLLKNEQRHGPMSGFVGLPAKTQN